MKKLIPAIAVLLAALLTVSSAAAAAVTDDSPDVVTLSEDEIVESGAPSISRMADLEEYEIVLDDEPVLSVERVAPVTGVSAQSADHFSVSFTVPGTAHEVFLTGLSAEHVDEVQQYIIRKYNSGDFAIERLSFIDAEKTLDADGDDNMCWAATASNMLTYTGWAAQAGFEDEDAVFDDFVSAFTDDAGDPQRAIEWFMDGSSDGSNSGYGPFGSFAVIRDYPNSGGYLRDYASDALTGFGAIEGVGDLNEAARLLKDDGCAVGLNVDVYYSNTGEVGGHAVTLWGFVIDASRNEDDPQRYVRLFIGDSDSDERSGSDRSGAPNIYRMFNLTYDGTNHYFKYNSKVYAFLNSYIYLEPYSDELPKETDPAATRSKADTPDLTHEGIHLTDTDGGYEFKDRFESGSTIYFMTGVINESDANYRGTLSVNITIRDSEGNIVSERTQSYSLGSSALYPSCYVTPSFFSASGLEAGDYTITYTINPAHPVTEAYYYNNVYTASFAMRDSYMIGDADLSGNISVLDVTRVQRRLAGYTVGMEGREDERGDINGNGLDILDGTVMQRYLAGEPVSSPVGGSRLYV